MCTQRLVGNNGTQGMPNQNTSVRADRCREPGKCLCLDVCIMQIQPDLPQGEDKKVFTYVAAEPTKKARADERVEGILNELGRSPASPSVWPANIPLVSG